MRVTESILILIIAIVCVLAKEWCLIFALCSSDAGTDPEGLAMGRMIGMGKAVSLPIGRRSRSEKCEFVTWNYVFWCIVSGILSPSPENAGFYISTRSGARAANFFLFFLAGAIAYTAAINPPLISCWRRRIQYTLCGCLITIFCYDVPLVLCVITTGDETVEVAATETVITVRYVR